MSKSLDILVLNSGSSSLKVGVFVADPAAGFARERAVATAQASGIGSEHGSVSVHDAEGNELASKGASFASQPDAFGAIVAALQSHGLARSPAAIGHRIVHGGPYQLEHARLSATVLARLQQAVHFAPLHLPGSLQLIEQAEKLFPDAEQIGCFDTAFHRTLPPVASRLPIPQRFADRGVRRYGFHGLSYESIVEQLKHMHGALAERVVIAHLGSGSSLCAVKRGRSIDTTMGLTPAGGIPMATRTGDLDPGVLLMLAREGHLSVDALEQLVNHEGGLAALSGGSGDMQALEAALTPGKKLVGQFGGLHGEPERAQLALAIFAQAIAKQVAALIVPLAGLDLLVFTGGIGEHSARVRTAVVALLAPFGVRLEAQANADHAQRLSAASSRVLVEILPAEEDLVIAMHARMLLGTGNLAAWVG